MTTLNMSQVNQKLELFSRIVQEKKQDGKYRSEDLKVGVDLGTSSIVLSVLNEKNEPVFGRFEYAHAVKDGLVVNFRESVNIVKRLKQEAEKTLNVPLLKAAGAVPPGTMGNNKKVVGNVIESADMENTAIIDEPVAAASLLQMKNGAVIDIGGGTTGISVFENGKVVFSADEPTGGTHMTLVLAGFYGISFEKAEQMKRDPAKEKDVFPIIRPVVEKMAEITRCYLETFHPETCVVVGGASYFQSFLDCFSNYLKRPVIQPVYPQFATPIGIAMNA